LHKEKWQRVIRSEQKTGKPVKPRKLKKNNRKNRTVKKPIRILKKTDRFGFDFISLTLKKPNRTELNPNKKNLFKLKKPSQTGFCSKIIEPNPVGLNRF
jgi:hypothetical protein